MSLPEKQGNDIVLSGLPPAVQSIIPPLGEPIFESARYVLDMRFNRSSTECLYWQDEVHVTGNPEGVARSFSITASTLAWINFFAKPEVVIGHSPEALENGNHYPGLHKDIERQTITGRRFGVGENYYAVNFDPRSGVELRPHSQIVEEGKLTPYMKQWLGRVVSKQNYIHPLYSDVQPFATWMRDETPDGDFDGSYFMHR